VAPVVHVGPDLQLGLGVGLAVSGTFEDPGPDTWTATVDYGDGSGPQVLPLAGSSFELAHRYTRSGTYTVTVTVTDDDGGSGADSSVVAVEAVESTIDGLIGQIEGLIGDGTLKLGQGKSLIGKLELALYMLEYGNTKKAITMLEAFIQEVEAFQRGGVLDDRLAQDLIAAAQAVIASLAG
jgi:hypothetical protein